MTTGMRRGIGWGLLGLAIPVWAGALEVTVIDSFNPGIGELEAIGVNHASGNVYAFNQVNGIRILQPDGTLVGSLPCPVSAPTTSISISRCAS